MSDYLRWGGSAILMLCALFISRCYKSYVNKRIAQTEGFVAFFSHTREKISMYLASPTKLVEGFRNESLESVGFLAALKECGKPGAAFSECSPRLSIGGELSRLLTEYFSGFGQGYKAEELARLDRFSKEAEKILEGEKRDLPQNARMVSTLLLAGAAGIVILLI